ncbi:uncharacterized protein LOC129573548 [Sitodiplosis mosellana]|uniref:uncharacterized protein LOC129573548 n=1 Tax=Sitodiplosis mosellana TaxID=263140 RepID=UPI002444ACDB|nr:uncharacterized protein LOC129573548 [Sitodiplosis mosellana]
MNRLMVARPVLRTMIQSNIAPLQLRFSHDHGPSPKEIGPPASFNQLPHPEGDWAENHNKKQSKYNAILAASALFFAATFGFMKQSGIIYFNASPPETYE